MNTLTVVAINLVFTLTNLIVASTDIGSLWNLVGAGVNGGIAVAMAIEWYCTESRVTRSADRVSESPLKLGQT